MLSDTDVEDHYNPSTRLIEIERSGSANCGFQLTRGKWDPYPWISSVEQDSVAFKAALKPGDCLLEVNGEDILGQRISEVAEIVKSKPDQVSLLLWNAGVDPQCTPEAVCCGPMPTNLQRLSACMSTILAFLECPVCLDTIPPPTYQCENGHLICIRCRMKSERCPVCRLRLTRGRSLLSDQVYTALVDAFNLREEPHEAKTAKIQQIFKLKSKKIPHIKITDSGNKLLEKSTTKSSSVDNLTTNLNFIESLKTKSLSTHDIFQNGSPGVSRSGSITRLSRNDKDKDSKNNNLSASYHGLFESLQTKSEDFGLRIKEERNLFYCPFATECTLRVEGGEIMEHFRRCHDGPFIQFFKSNLKVNLSKVIKKRDLFYVIQLHENTFFLKFKLINITARNETSEKVLVWTWLLGNKQNSRDYDMQINVINKEMSDVIISVRNNVLSLSGTPYQEIKDFKKGVLLNVRTLEILNSSLKNVVLDINIVKNDFD